jgi:hypothetical protein
MVYAPRQPTGWALRMTVDKKGMVAGDTVLLRLDEQGVAHSDVSHVVRSRQFCPCCPLFASDLIFICSTNYQIDSCCLP